MNSALLILGNQLFPVKNYKQLNVSHAFMAEDFGLCTHYKYHKHKIIFFLSAMRSFSSELEKAGLKVSYYNCHHGLFKDTFEAKLDDFLSKNVGVSKFVSFSIEDKFFEERIIKYCKTKNIIIEFIPSPMFMTSRDQFKEYLEGRKKPFMKTFYQLQREKFKVLLDSEAKPVGGQWSFDKENRKKMPKKLQPPELNLSVPGKVTLQVARSVDKLFSSHPGDIKKFWLPTTRRESLQWLDDFIHNRLEHFGDYQDAITPRSTFVFHSVISPMINAGLLLPSEVIDRVESAYLGSPSTVPINAVEGFIRQVLGWREFVRGVYQEYSEVQWSTNFWNHNRALNQCWYDGTTGIPVLDDAIIKANTYGYNHHIERLMIISNMMLLCEIHPHSVYSWFMEMSVDSSDWVMGPNVFGMGQFSDGGVFATKPYICGSNYYLKMSDYKKGDWCQIVDGLYWRFIDKNKDFYKKNPRMSMMVKMLDKMDPVRRSTIFQAADDFIDITTHSEGL